MGYRIKKDATNNILKIVITVVFLLLSYLAGTVVAAYDVHHNLIMYNLFLEKLTVGMVLVALILMILAIAAWFLVYLFELFFEERKK